jgi:hypothetical protein
VVELPPQYALLTALFPELPVSELMSLHRVASQITGPAPKTEPLPPLENEVEATVGPVSI